MPYDRAYALEHLPRVLEELDSARTAYAEIQVAELNARHATLKAEYEAHAPAGKSEKWAEMDAAPFTHDRLRRKVDIDRLTDQRDFLMALLAPE